MSASVVVVGGGIAGLSAATALAQHATVTVLEAAPELGGKIQTTTFRGRPLDRGPDAFITRNPSMVELARDSGLGEELIAPSATSAAIYPRGRLRPFPNGLAIGIPTDQRALRRSGILSPVGRAHASLDAVLPGRFSTTLAADAAAGTADPTVGSIVGSRLGREVVTTLVDPVIGGINASDVDALSFAASLPQLTALVAGKRRIMSALRPPGSPRSSTTPPRSPIPIFQGLLSGLGSIIEAIRRDLIVGGTTIWTQCEVRSAEHSLDGKWHLVTSQGSMTADGIVLAVPTAQASSILRRSEPQIAAELSEIPYAGVATVTLAWPADVVPRATADALTEIARRPDASRPSAAQSLPGSGVLVPRPGGSLITAATFTSTKWPRSANPGEVVIRASAGRHHDDRALQLSDDELVLAVRSELESILGISAIPLEHTVERWPDPFPQYVSGHLARVARIRSLAGAIGRMALCGAGYDGIGIPACIDSGTRAAQVLLASLAE